MEPPAKRLPLKSNCPGCNGVVMHRTWSLDHFECECISPWDGRTGCGCTWAELSYANTQEALKQAERDAALKVETQAMWARERRADRLTHYRQLSVSLFIIGAFIFTIVPKSWEAGVAVGFGINLVGIWVWYIVKWAQ